MPLRAISFAVAAVGAVRPKLDTSCTISIVTGEMTPEQQVVLLSFLGKNVKVLMESVDDPDAEAPVEVKGEKNVKSLSTRLYDVLFVWWKQQGEPGDFEQFRKNHMEKFITHVKSKLDPF